MPIWAWRLGGALLVAIPNEPYSVLQVELRRRFSPTPVFVLGVTNRTMGYLSPEETYGTGLYQSSSRLSPRGVSSRRSRSRRRALEELRR